MDFHEIWYDINTTRSHYTVVIFKFLIVNITSKMTYNFWSSAVLAPHNIKFWNLVW
jgi:hypothetical protein